MVYLQNRQHEHVVDLNIALSTQVSRCGTNRSAHDAGEPALAPNLALTTM